MDNSTPAAIHGRGRSLIARSLVWNTLSQVVLALLNFASTLVLVRFLSPAEFGKAAAVSGFVAVVNCFSCSQVITQAIQLRDGETPDWESHWNAGFCIQLVLVLVCNAVAGAAWLFPAYRPIAPLLQVASIGVLIDVPNQIALTALRREMNFQMLRTLQGICTLISVVVSISMALSGAGAYALIVPGNVLFGVPFGLYLLVIRRWRPASRWWQWPDWTAYRAPLTFGGQMAGSAMLAATRGLLESLALPRAIGYDALGLLNRAQVLFSTSVGRANALVIETVYPLLPRSAADSVRFGRLATLFVETMLLISIPGAVYVGLEGPSLSRLLYGVQWSAADPLILPATILAWGVATTMVLSVVFQAANRLRDVVTSALITTCMTAPAILVALTWQQTLEYAWALAAGQVMATAVLFIRLNSNIPGLRLYKALYAPTLASCAAAGAMLLFRPVFAEFTITGRAAASASLFMLVAFVVVRWLFPRMLHELIVRLPWGERLTGLVRLRPETPGVSAVKLTHNPTD